MYIYFVVDLQEDEAKHAKDQWKWSHAPFNVWVWRMIPWLYLCIAIKGKHPTSHFFSIDMSWRFCWIRCCSLLVCIWKRSLLPVKFMTSSTFSGISQIDGIGNNANIGIRGFTTWKNSSDKMLPLVGIEPGPVIASDSKSNTILSTVTWHLLARPRL